MLSQIRILRGVPDNLISMQNDRENLQSNLSFTYIPSISLDSLEAVYSDEI